MKKYVAILGLFFAACSPENAKRPAPAQVAAGGSGAVPPEPCAPLTDEPGDVVTAAQAGYRARAECGTDLEALETYWFSAELRRSF